MNEPWIFAGLTSSFANIEPEAGLSDTNSGKTKIDIKQPDQQDASSPGQISSCKIFEACSNDSLGPSHVEVTPEKATSSLGLEEQVLIFQYRGKFYAVNHECPHRSYPLSKGAIYDIEDFGIILSAGITCPKHGWAFDLHTGESDKGGYRMKVWDVQLRDRPESVQVEEDDEAEIVKEVWVRKKRQRIG